MVIVSPSLNRRMWSWQTVVPRSGPWAMPLTTRPHMPQIPSRQSESNAMASFPWRTSPSLTTSSISRKDMSGDTSAAVYSSRRPGVSRSTCRQIFRFSLTLDPVRLQCEKGVGSRFEERPPKRLPTPFSLVAPLRWVHFLEDERLLVQRRFLTDAGELPRRHVRVMLIVAQRLAVRRLAFLAEVASARFLPMQRVKGQQLGEFEIVGDAAGIFEILVEIVRSAGNRDLVPELSAHGRDLFEGSPPARVRGRVPD